jgi:hypothetical protein
LKVRLRHTGAAVRGLTKVAPPDNAEVANAQASRLLGDSAVRSDISIPTSQNIPFPINMGKNPDFSE